MSSCDFFTAFIYIPVGFVYYHTIGTIQNVCIRKANKKLQKKAAKSWTPTSYKAFAVDAVIVTSVLALGILGTKYFCSVAKSSINQKPNGIQIPEAQPPAVPVPIVPNPAAAATPIEAKTPQVVDVNIRIISPEARAQQPEARPAEKSSFDWKTCAIGVGIVFFAAKKALYHYRKQKVPQIPFSNKAYQTRSLTLVTDPEGETAAIMTASSLRDLQ